MSDKILEAARRYAGDCVCPLNNGVPVTPDEQEISKQVALHFMAGVEWRDILEYSKSTLMLEALKKIMRECEWNEPDRGWPDEDNSEKNKITAIAQAAIDAVEGKEGI